MSKFKLIFNLLDLVYPECCAGCMEPLIYGEDTICSSCLIELPFTDFHAYPDNPVSKLFLGRSMIAGASAFLYFEKGGIVQHLMHCLKYKGQKKVGLFMGKMMGRALKGSEFLSTVDSIIPVPLHPAKLKRRGYNQSEIIGHGITESTGIPLITNSLIRINNNETQTRKSRFARWQNVETIFTVHRPELLTHKHILLIDDVITTGATAEACANKLLSVPGLRVSLLTLAHAKH